VEYPDVEQLVRERPKRRIVVNAYLQRYAYYAGHLENIRKWLQFLDYDRDEFDAGSDSLTVHIRLGDYLQCNWALEPQYYARQIEAIPHQSLMIVTDSPQSNFLQHFRQYHPKIVHGDTLDAFKWLVNAHRLVLSQSTFGWWAAILSGRGSLDAGAEVFCLVPGLAHQAASFRQFTMAHRCSRYTKTRTPLYLNFNRYSARFPVGPDHVVLPVINPSMHHFR
jgi:hypothetical protein